MSDNTLIYIIIAIVVAHFLFAIIYLVYKIMKAPKSSTDSTDQEKLNDSF